MQIVNAKLWIQEMLRWILFGCCDMLVYILWYQIYNLNNNENISFFEMGEQK